MVTTGFGICLVLSVLAAIFLAQRGYDNVDGHYWAIIILSPIIIMGYWLKAQTATPEASIVLFYFINVGMTVLLAVVLFALLREIGLVVKPWVKGVVYGAALVQLLVVWSLSHDGPSPGMVQITNAGEGYSTRMLAGPFWFAQYAYLLAIAIDVFGIGALLRSRTKTYSRRVLTIYTVLVGAGIVIYTAESVWDTDFSLLPYLLTAASAVTALNYDNAHSHNISSLVSEQQDSQTARGYVAIGLNGWFLSCNEKSCEFLPALKAQRVDTAFPSNSELGDLFYGLIDDFKRNGTASTKFSSGEKTYACDIAHFSIRRDDSAQGYLIDIRDATQEQRALDILSGYNDTLNREVAEKTEHILKIQRKIVLGMANMVENRDSNTGGHVKRTSDVIQILVDEILSQDHIKLDDVLARDIVRAAPMHDLGKISIDSSILNKPGKLTDEECEIMKTHSTTSGQMVMILLDGVEEDHFVETAFHVARYHHERWDGKGYPEGLVGEMIPLEARIMAVADVYDALVSKRVYKEPLSFEKASKIMCEGMGTQFDPNMRLVFLGCRDKLEEYYSTAGN